MESKTIVLAAGGTGGHLFPAQALAHELILRGFQIHLATDKRAEKFADNFPAKEKHIIRSATLGSKNPVVILKAFGTLFSGYRQSAALIKKTQSAAVIGFGGYPTLPPLIAASRMGVPCLVHEQNAILGRANRLLARFVKAIAIGFALVGERPKIPVIETGNPVRPNVMKVKDSAYPLRSANDHFRLVVFGGSQGARIFSDVVPAALASLGEDIVNRVKLVQQVREEDMVRVGEVYKKLGIDHEISPFFNDMPSEISKAHLVIARAGASSVSELAVIGRPAILVPFPGSLDGDQAANAAAMEKAGGAELVLQKDFTAQILAERLGAFIANPENLAQMARHAKSTAIPDAAKRLADCVEYAISSHEKGEDFSKFSA